MSALCALSMDDRVAVSRQQVSSELAGEVVVLNVKSGVYHSLEGSAARVWELLANPVKVADIYDTLLAEFDVDPDTCRQDLFNFLGELQQNELLDVNI